MARGLRNELIWWGVLAGGAVLLIAVAYVWLPDWLVGDELNRVDELKARNDVRSSGVQAVTAIAAAIGVFLTARTYLLTRRGQLSERLSRATGELTATLPDGKPHFSARSNAILDLETIARESEADHWPIVQRLTQYLRDEAAWDPKDPMPERARTDVQTAIGVLNRRRHERERREEQRLDLRHTDLRRVVFQDARLDGANLSGAHLEEALFLGDTHLRGASLIETMARGVTLTGADLGGGAVLRGATLDKAELRRATLTGAALDETRLCGADLTDSTVGEELLAAFLDEETICPDGSPGPDCRARG